MNLADQIKDHVDGFKNMISEINAELKTICEDLNNVKEFTASSEENKKFPKEWNFKLVINGLDDVSFNIKLDSLIPSGNDLPASLRERLQQEILFNLQKSLPIAP